MAVADKVKSIIVEQLGVDEEEVTPDASFVDDLGAARRSLLRERSTLPASGDRRRRGIGGSHRRCRTDTKKNDQHERQNPGGTALHR